MPKKQMILGVLLVALSLVARAQEERQLEIKAYPMLSECGEQVQTQTYPMLSEEGQDSQAKAYPVLNEEGQVDTAEHAPWR